MKKLCFIVICAALLGACKKDSPSKPKEILLSKVYVNGLLESEFIYNSGKQLSEEKYYENDGGSTVLNSRYEYLYDNNGHLAEKRSYDMPANKLTYRYIFTVDDQGNILRNAIYDVTGGGPGTVQFFIDHEYNKDGRLIKQTWKDGNEEVSDYRSLTYYPNGNLRTSESFSVYGGVAEKKWGSGYGPSDTTLPASFTNVKAFPINYYYFDLLTPYINNYTYDDGAVEQEYKQIFTGRQFNSKGWVKEQTVTTKHIKPVSADEVTTYKYEYVEF